MKNFKIKSKKGLSVSGVSVMTDWVIIFLFVVLFFILAVIVSFNIYLSIKNNSIISNEETNVTNPLHVNTEQLDRVVENLNDRKEKFDALTGGIELTTTPEEVDLVE